MLKMLWVILACLMLAAIPMSGQENLLADDGVELIPYTPTFTEGIWNDVFPDSFAAAWATDMGIEGISVGCGGGSFCPDMNTSRAQESVFIIRALHHKHTDGGTGATVITGATGPCEDNQGGVQSCIATEVVPGLRPTFAVTATYRGEIGSAGARPISILSVDEGSFTYETKDGLSFFYMAAPLPPSISTR